jgi:hypothetical protein
MALNEVVELEADADEDRPVTVRWRLQPLPDRSGFVPAGANLPSLKSMTRCSRSSRSCVP